MKAPVALVAILNVTPDSFSDGGKFTRLESALAQARQLRAEGADFIEIGGDSTRPGSRCVGAQEEWLRIAPLLQELRGEMPLAVDTHHAEVAKRALEFGVSIINDVSAGADPQMFPCVAGSATKLALMYSRCPRPHLFGPEGEGDLVQMILEFWNARLASALAAGLSEEQLVFDSGMGAFISEKPQRSLELLGRYSELQSFGHSLMLAISRKGFTRQAQETCIDERDRRSQELALDVLEKANLSHPVYLRVHNVALHQAALTRINAPRPTS